MVGTRLEKNQAFLTLGIVIFVMGISGQQASAILIDSFECDNLTLVQSVEGVTQQVQTNVDCAIEGERLVAASAHSPTFPGPDPPRSPVSTATSKVTTIDDVGFLQLIVEGAGTGGTITTAWIDTAIVVVPPPPNPAASGVVGTAGGPVDLTSEGQDDGFLFHFGSVNHNADGTWIITVSDSAQNPCLFDLPLPPDDDEPTPPGVEGPIPLFIPFSFCNPVDGGGTLVDTNFADVVSIIMSISTSSNSNISINCIETAGENNLEFITACCEVDIPSPGGVQSADEKSCDGLTLFKPDGSAIPDDVEAFPGGMVFL